MSSRYESYELFASCLAGHEQLLAEELKSLGARRIRPLVGGVAFYATIKAAEKICLWTRLAARVLLVLDRVDARNADALYDESLDIPWEQILAHGATFAVHANGTNAELRNSKFTALKVKDALCDRMREERGERPTVDTDKPDAVIDVRVREKKATVSLDLSRSSLHKRAYLEPDASAEAPLLCAQAAGLLALAGWSGLADRNAACFDAACGDGEVIIEAASVACDMAPGLLRDDWGFFGWLRHDDDIWNELLDEADDRFMRGLESVQPGAAEASSSDIPDVECIRFVGTSISSPSIARARSRARRAGLRQVVSIEACDDDNIDALVKRTLSARGSGDECLVASVLPSEDRSQGDARGQADVSAFVKASSAAAALCENATFAIVGGSDVRSRFGTAPCKTESVGRGRIEAPMLVFDKAPAQGVIVMIPDNHGGAEHPVEVYEQTTDQFVSRLRKVAKERRKWARREGVSCYRVYDADLPGYSAAIDVYEGAGHAEGNTYIHVAEYAPPSSIDEGKARRRFSDIMTVVPVVMDVRPDHVFSKVRQHGKGGSQYSIGGRRNYVTEVKEGPYLLEVDLAGYLDTGLFLDHRITRIMIENNAEDTRFLNLFAYTGTATVHAAGGGARQTTTVDLSQTYLDWAKRNMEKNGFDGPEHTYERADVMNWITDARRNGRRFDLVFVDPPTFSNSKSMGPRVWDVQRDHVEMLIGVSRLLSEQGIAVFSCNLRNFKPDTEQLMRYGVELEDITPETIPHDFERNPKIHHCYLVRHIEKN